MTSEIVMIRTSSLGDVILTAGTILSAQREGISVRLVTRRVFGRLLEGIPGLAEVLPMDTPEDLVALKARAQSLSGIPVLDLQANLRSRRIAGWFGGGPRACIAKGNLSRRMAVWFGMKGIRVVPRVEAYRQALARLLRHDVPFEIPRLFPSEMECAEAEAFATQLWPNEGARVILFAGARHPTKALDPHYLSRVSDILRRQGTAPVWLLDSPNSDEYNRLPAIGPDPAWASGDLRRVAALLSVSDVLLCGDSGLMHLAAAVGCGVVAMFGPTHPLLGFAPQTPRQRLFIPRAECSPCSLHGQTPCRMTERFCMTRVPPEEVARAALQLSTERNPR